MDDTITITLSKPITLGTLEFTELNLSEPIVKHLREASKAGSGIDAMATLIHLNAKVPMAVVDQLKQRDFEACNAFLDSFSSASPETSAT